MPSAKQCITAPVTGSGPPFNFTLADCEFSDDSSQVFSNFIKQSDNKIYFVGGYVLIYVSLRYSLADVLAVN